jgi:phosphatidylinositol 4-phosphatase
MGEDIYSATGFEILPLDANASVTHPLNAVEGHLIALLQAHLKTGTFLFSYTWDLTRRLQAQWENSKKDEGKAMWEVVRLLAICWALLELSPCVSGRR